VRVVVVLDAMRHVNAKVGVETMKDPEDGDQLFSVINITKADFQNQMTV